MPRGGMYSFFEPEEGDVSTARGTWRPSLSRARCVCGYLADALRKLIG
jgi:hypothetical protein